MPAVLQVNACGLTTKYVLQLYCETVCFSRNERWSTYLRIQVSHHCTIAAFNEEKLKLSLSSIDCKLFVALIQDADYGIAGWLYGIYTSTLNVEHYTTDLNAHSKLGHIAVMFCDRIIKRSLNGKQPAKKQVRTDHILVSRRHTILACVCVVYFQ